MRKLTIIICLFLAACSPTAITQRDAYYQGIQDYCEHVTIVNAATGESVNRTHEYCVDLVSDLRSKNFYEKYHPSNEG